MPGWVYLVFLKKSIVEFHLLLPRCNGYFEKFWIWENLCALFFFLPLSPDFYYKAFAKLNRQWRKITTAYARSRRTPQSVHYTIWAVLQFSLTTAPTSVEIKPWNKQLTKRDNNLKLTESLNHWITEVWNRVNDEPADVVYVAHFFWVFQRNCLISRIVELFFFRDDATSELEQPQNDWK